MPNRFPFRPRSLTGLILWWPRNGAFVKGLRWRRTPMTMDNLHHMIGFWICAPLLVLSLTGVYISFPQTSRAVFGVAQAQQGPPRPRTPPAAPIADPALSIDQAADAAQLFAPRAEIVAVTFPTVGEAPSWRVEMQRTGAAGPLSVKITDASGEAAADRAPAGGRGNQDKLSRLMRQIHDGADTGPIWQTIVFLGGIAPAVLSITGLVMWLRRRARRTALKPALAAE